MTNLDNLAARFFMEKELLLDALIPRSGFRGLLEARMQAEHKMYFKTIRGPKDYDVGGYRTEHLLEKQKEHARRAARGSRDTLGCCKGAWLLARCVSPPMPGESWSIKVARFCTKPYLTGLEKQLHFETTGYLATVPVARQRAERIGWSATLAQSFPEHDSAFWLVGAVC
jgi:hypothetical protein